MKKARRNCRHGYCSNIPPDGSGFCSEHKKYSNRRDKQEYRRTNDKKYTRATWKKLRRKVLKRDAICQWSDCEQPAKEVDHITPLADGGSDRMENLQGLCKKHHSKKTMMEKDHSAKEWDYSSDERNFGGGRVESLAKS